MFLGYFKNVKIEKKYIFLRYKYLPQNGILLPDQIGLKSENFIIQMKKSVVNGIQGIKSSAFRRQHFFLVAYVIVVIYSWTRPRHKLNNDGTATTTTTANAAGVDVAVSVAVDVDVAVDVSARFYTHFADPTLHLSLPSFSSFLPSPLFPLLCPESLTGSHSWLWPEPDTRCTII